MRFLGIDVAVFANRHRPSDEEAPALIFSIMHVRTLQQWPLTLSLNPGPNLHPQPKVLNSILINFEHKALLHGPSLCFSGHFRVFLLGIRTRFQIARFCHGDF